MFRHPRLSYKLQKLMNATRPLIAGRRPSPKDMPSDDQLTKITPEARQIAAERSHRARQVESTGNYDYAIQLLLTCCKLDPPNFLFRQTLRQTQKAKYKNNLRGSRLAFMTTIRSRAKLKAAKRGRDYYRLLEHGEQIL